MSQNSNPTVEGQPHASTTARLDSKKLFGLMDMNPALSPFQRIKNCIHLQGTQGSNSSEFQVVADLVPISALPDGQKTIYEITLSPFYCSARGTLSSWGATSIFDICTLLSLSTIFSLPPTAWCIDLPRSSAPPQSLENGTRIMNFAGASRSLNVEYSRPAFVGQKVRVVCGVLSLSEGKAVIKADMLGMNGKLCCSAVHDVASMASKLKGML